MTIDSEGMLWIALWDGFGVARYNPATGKLLRKIDVPAPKVTSCAFGGENLDVLFITTARVEMSAEELEQYPLSGAIFIAEPGIKGVPAYSFNMKI
jgi:sugar lactone lactonase YvrE